MNLDEMFDGFWRVYSNLNPDAKKIQNVLCAGREWVNDHIAFRTFNLENFGISRLAEPFVSRGYSLKGRYRFQTKRLLACHYEHIDPLIPKIFISELLVEEFSGFLQETMQFMIKDVQPPTDLFLTTGRGWRINYKIYSQLLRESEYAAWLYIFGFVPNHFTIYINSLNNFDSLVEVNQVLKKNGYRVNANGGEIKGSPALGLEQSSTLAYGAEVEFEDLAAIKKIPACYYEFVKRYDSFNGFIAGSADKIFESTDVKQVSSSGR